MGKAYANRKPMSVRPLNDFYPTPSCMTEELVKTGVLDNVKTIWDCCCGEYAIINVLKKHGFNCFGNDIIYGDDYLAREYQHHECIVMNPPFKLFDKFIYKAKKEADLVCAIGKANFFGSHSRNINGLWEHLREVYFFDRQIAFDIPEDADGQVECGMMITGWFVWDMKYNGEPKIKVIDMQKYIKKKKNKRVCMKKEETKLKIENYLNKFPQVIEPCEMCVNKTDVYAEMCSVCCYFYASHFEIDFSKEIKE